MPGFAFAYAMSSATFFTGNDVVDDHEIGAGDRERDGGEITLDVVRRALLERRIGGDHRGVQQDRVAVGRGARDRFGADGARGAGAVVDESPAAKRLLLRRAHDDLRRAVALADPALRLHLLAHDRARRVAVVGVGAVVPDAVHRRPSRPRRRRSTCPAARCRTRSASRRRSRDIAPRPARTRPARRSRSASRRTPAAGRSGTRDSSPRRARAYALNDSPVRAQPACTPLSRSAISGRRCRHEVVIARDVVELDDGRRSRLRPRTCRGTRRCPPGRAPSSVVVIHPICDGSAAAAAAIRAGLFAARHDAVEGRDRRARVDRVADLAVGLVERLAVGGVLRERRHARAGEQQRQPPRSQRAKPHVISVMNPRSLVGKRDRFGNTDAKSAVGTPNHFASVAPYWSTDVVGIQRPRCSASSGPPSASVGYLPKKSPPFTASPMTNWWLPHA